MGLYQLDGQNDKALNQKLWDAIAAAQTPPLTNGVIYVGLIVKYPAPTEINLALVNAKSLPELADYIKDLFARNAGQCPLRTPPPTPFPTFTPTPAATSTPTRTASPVPSATPTQTRTGTPPIPHTGINCAFSKR